MRRSYLAAMEVFASKATGAFELEPMEAAWASEAVAFVYVEEFHEGASLDVRAQISADGRRWIDFKHMPTITGSGGYYLQLSHFGTWLRLTGDVRGGPQGGAAALVAHFFWDLKE